MDDQRQRNAFEGKIGQGKRRYGLDLIREKLAVTQGSTIAINVLVMNLQKLLELLFVLFAALPCLLLGNACGRSVRTMPLKPQIAMLIALRAQAGPLFVEADPGFTFSGGPNSFHGISSASLIQRLSPEKLSTKWQEEILERELITMLAPKHAESPGRL